MMVEMPLRKLSILALLAFAAFSASALTVGIAPAEGKAYAPSPEGLGSPINGLVSGCMNVIFAAGYVVTEASPERTAHSEWGSPDYGIAAAREGFVDYLIALYVEWANSSFHKNALLAVSVDYRLVRVRDGKVLAEGRVPGPADSEDTSSHEMRTASQAGASAADTCMKTLSTLAMGGE